MSVPRRVYVFLAIGLAAASQSANIIRIGDAHPVAIAAWRLCLATIILAPVAWPDLFELFRGVRGGGTGDDGRSAEAGEGRIAGRQVVLVVLAGLALALHFFAWIAAVQMTTVANAVLLFAVNPVITATAAHFLFDERIGFRLAMAIAVGVAGAATIGGSDLSLAPSHLKGDGAAVLCSVLFSAYFLLGKSARKKIPTKAYVTMVYGVAAAISFATMGLLGLPVVDYSPRTWLCFVLMAVVPTVIGHTSINHAVGYIGAGWISAATLSEPLAAAVVAYFAWNETVHGGTVAGYVLIAASVLLLVFWVGNGRARRAEGRRSPRASR